ncbi:MAG: PEP-CTERM sorting domain-containing protein [Verrucomicrobiota bacterium]|nr:PEP-CTERM sorting domain-containing protein [Verrucomicrobiota bacterium]
MLGTVPTVFTGSLYNEATGQDISGFAFYDIFGGTNPDQFAYLNNIAVVPELSTLLLLALGGLAIIALARRRQRAVRLFS